ncbi:class I SAM-dependent methyltransferase [Streptomyces sp. NPDC014733]|uniref:class I SAM-dependent methyltransferase n=1 Tax=Streptomyces sp. NPDC014733 TaxID=3364885 RepID=UPI0036F89638
MTGPTDAALLAHWYDACNPWGACDDFFLGLVMRAGAVLDVGCGTGTLLHRARERGHRGRLCGLDPDPAMLARARAGGPDGIDWIAAGLGATTDPAELGGIGAAPEFDLVVMTGHAFQVLCEDAELRAALTVVRRALAPGGRFAFETRNPAARAWERWTPAHAVEVTGPDGARARIAHRVHRPVDGRSVRFTTTLSGPGLPRPVQGDSTLRFLSAAALDGFLAGAGLAVEERYGDWDRAAFGPASPEIITVAGVSPGPRPCVRG